MANPKPVKSYWVWFKPDSEHKAPPRNRVYVSTTADPPSLHSATVIAMNADTPSPEDGSAQGFWNRTALTSPDELCSDVDNELMALNRGKEIQYSQARWV